MVMNPVSSPTLHVTTDAGPEKGGAHKNNSPKKQDRKM